MDIRSMGFMKDRVLRDFTREEIKEFAITFHNWQKGEEYADQAGLWKSSTIEQIEKHDFVLTPGRYVGAAAEEDDGEPFAEKMARLTTQLKEQFEQSEQLEGDIRKNLVGLGYEV